MIIGIEAAHANKPQRTGVENYCWHVIQELKKQIPSTARVVLYSNTPLQGELGVLPPNWEAKILRWPLEKLWSQIRLSWELWRNPPDVFFAPGQLIPWVCPAKIVATIHDSAFLAFPSAYNFLGRIYLKWMNRLIVKKAVVILTPSQFSKNELKKYYKINEEKIKVTPLGYDSNVFKSLGIPREPMIMSLGRLEEKKNTIGIVKSFNILKKTHPDLKLILVGAPRVGYEKIKQEIEASPYKSDIILPGWINEQEIVGLLNKASVFLIPSLYEGFGLPVLEAMACGAPVVASAGNSLAEVGGGAVLYADPQNINEIAGAVDKLLADHNLREEKIKAGLERVKNFSWEKTGANTWETISKIVNV
ncbi:MAG: glycosyltransferase family 1 protein [Patescibacteria group bacterium]